MNKLYRLGTRKSLLAVAQSSWVARELERLNPGIKIELVGIETQGDKVLDKPLSKMEGKEFFTAELDHALLRGDVDMTVHSMKDLSLDRPSQIKLAAVPPRELPHDVIVFNNEVLERIKNRKPIRIGTSSPRRLTLVPGFLKQALPRFEENQEPILEFIEIRGNVNTRISRVHEPENSDRKLDAVVLAFAGLERLAIDPVASIELKRLLDGTRLMITPLNVCPSAPAQGALAIEAREDQGETLQVAGKLHDQNSLNAVVREREILGEWGGGCHQKLGASYNPVGELFIKGVKPDGTFVEEIRGRVKFDTKGFTRIDASDVFGFEERELTAVERAQLDEAKLIFIAHSRAYEFLSHKISLLSNEKRIWVSGTKSWFKLARQGLWIEGSLEGQGFDSLKIFNSKKLLRIDSPFLFLTHDESAAVQSEVPSLGTYFHRFRELPEKLKTATEIYWGSGLTFETVAERYGIQNLLQIKHFAGPGKTAEVLKQHLTPYGVMPYVSTFES